MDDSSFFRNLLTPILEAAGYTVTQAENGEVGLEACKTGGDFDVIVSDLEMPVLDGFGFVSELRRNPGFEQVPIVALSAHASPQDISRCEEAGFTSHVEKLNKDSLLKKLKECANQARDAA